ncbi:hypothetical protein T06_1563 [Trichinella sp. T6]|nr:hypothetical protein T06_1563 [Trichinella sp. T6]
MSKGNLLVVQLYLGCRRQKWGLSSTYGSNVGYFGDLVVFGPCGGYAVVRSLPLVCFLFYGAIFIDFLSEYPWLSVIPIVTATTKLHLRITFTFFWETGGKNRYVSMVNAARWCIGSRYATCASRLVEHL